LESAQAWSAAAAIPAVAMVPARVTCKLARSNPRREISIAMIQTLSRSGVTAAAAWDHFFSAR
jgi:hypothetical protein